MYTVFLAGGIASGKSTVLSMLRSLGAEVLSLDDLSREVTARGSDVNERLAQAFGTDVLDDDGSLRRSVLAGRAFASEEATRRLEGIVHPAIRARLREFLLANDDAKGVRVIEIPLLDRVEDLDPLADEVLCVTCPLELRRLRAQGRGMDAADFDARVARQRSEAYLVSRADTLLHNDGDQEDLRAQVGAWWRGLSRGRDADGTDNSYGQ